MNQIYSFSSLRVSSKQQIIQFKDYQSTIKDYLLYILSVYKDGLSCRDIADLSGISLQSLTNPLQELQEAGRAQLKGVKRDLKTNRVVQIYTLISNSKTAA